jgi:hypothetical protein
LIPLVVRTKIPVIPEAAPQARLSGTSGNESSLAFPRSRLGALLAFGAQRSVRDDGCSFQYL